MEVVVYVEQRQNGIMRLSLIDIETEKEIPDAYIIIPLKEIYKAHDLISFWRGRLLREIERVKLNQPKPLEVFCPDGTLIPVKFETNDIRQVYRFDAPIKSLCCGATFLSDSTVELIDRLDDNTVSVLVGQCKHTIKLSSLIRNSKCIGVSA